VNHKGIFFFVGKASPCRYPAETPVRLQEPGYRDPRVFSEQPSLIWLLKENKQIRKIERTRFLPGTNGPAESAGSGNLFQRSNIF
jgi:hypothetical protein